MALKNGYAREVDHEGKLYRVRDKDRGKGEPVIIWGDDLTHEEAHKLKESVCGRELSNNARIVPVDEELPANAVTPKGQPYVRKAQPYRANPIDAMAAAAGGGGGSGKGMLITASSPKHPDPTIAAAQARAMAAGRAQAAAAQQRAENLVPIPQHPGQEDPAPIPGEDIEVPEGIDEDLDALLTDGGEGDAVVTD